VPIRAILHPLESGAKGVLHQRALRPKFLKRFEGNFGALFQFSRIEQIIFYGSNLEIAQQVLDLRVL
jgi:hypothetical protein